MENFSISELDRKLANIIRLGIVKEIDYQKARARIKIGKILTDWLPWITARAGEDRSWSAPSIGEQVVILSPSGDMAQGVILPAIYQQKYPAPGNDGQRNIFLFQDGSQISYDRENSSLTFSIIEQGKITLQVGESSLEMTKDSIKLQAKHIDIQKL